MDFDIGNLIYIIFVIVIFIVNLFTQSKKKANQRKQPRPRQQDSTTVGPPPVSKRSTFEELLEEFTGNQPTPEPTPAPVEYSRPAPVVAERPKPKPKPKPKPISTTAQSKLEHRSMAGPFNKFDEYEEEDGGQSEYASIFKDLDGARKAFVYSEIFNRKY